MIFKQVDQYLAKLFLIRIFALSFTLILAALMFESLMAKQAVDWLSAMKKIPFLLHKFLPFLVFLGALLLLWRLIRFHEWEAFSSSGLSLARLLAAPLSISLLLSLGDLFGLAPLSQQLIEPLLFKEKRGRLSLKGEGWHVQAQQDQYSLFFRQGDRFHVFTFSPESSFKHHLMAQKATLRGRFLVLQDGWALTPGKTPQPFSDRSLPLPFIKTSKNQHPSFMSFLEVNQALPHNQPQKKLLRFRQGYLLANALWIVTLVPLAASIILGPSRGQKRLISIILGLGFCLATYLGKEWLYALSLPLSYLLKPIVSWSAPALTLLLSFIILFEKNEL